MPSSQIGCCVLPLLRVICSSKTQTKDDNAATTAMLSFKLSFGVYKKCSLLSRVSFFHCSTNPSRSVFYCLLCSLSQYSELTCIMLLLLLLLIVLLLPYTTAFLHMSEHLFYPLWNVLYIFLQFKGFSSSSFYLLPKVENKYVFGFVGRNVK